MVETEVSWDDIEPLMGQHLHCPWCGKELDIVRGKVPQQGLGCIFAVLSCPDNCEGDGVEGWYFVHLPDQDVFIISSSEPKIWDKSISNEEKKG